MDLTRLILECQEAVGVRADGKPGMQTWTAIHRRLVVPEKAVAAISTKLDARSESNIATLHPRVQPYARSLIQSALSAGWTFRITSALRTYDEQNALYAQGRTAPGKRVTNARGGYSNHNFGIAFDVTLFEAGQPVWESALYKRLGALGVGLGLEWGGHWKSPVDEPHYQLRPAWAAGMPERVMLTELRRRKTAGVDFYA